jgi:hypothetical protein
MTTLDVISSFEKVLTKGKHDSSIAKKVPESSIQQALSSNIEVSQNHK